MTDKDGKPLAVVGGFKGAIDSASVPIAPVIAEDVRVRGAANIWLSHNHPSGLSELSSADRNLHRAFEDAFAGSGIEVRGLIAVGRGEYEATDYTNGRVPAEGNTVRVPVIEREQVGEPLAVTIESPAAARAVAAEYYEEAGRPGMILLDTRHRVTGWAPFTPGMTSGALRNTGGLNALYRAVSEGNVAAAILVHGGELDTLLVGTHDSGMNIAAGLNKAGVRVLDVVNAETRHSRAEKGGAVVGNTLYRLSDTKARGIPLFSARAIAKKVMAATGLNATVVNTEADLPADLQAQIKRDKATGRVAGVYHNGTAYLVASNLRDAKHAVSVMLHEAVGHGGVKSVLGDKLGKVMAGIYRDMPAAMGDWSLTKVQAYRKTLMEQGHDGLYIQGLSWPVVFEGKNIKARRNQGTFDASERTRYNITEADFAAFDGAVDALARGKTFDKPIVIGRTPEVLKALGAADAPINISEDALWKAIDKHSLTPRDIKSAVKGIGSPVMVFDSATAPDGLVVLVEAFSRGRPVVVAVHLNRKENIIVNRIASMHAKDSPQFVRKWLDDGLLRYVDNKKADEWFNTIGLQLPKAEPKHRLGKKILRPADIDKFKTDERGDTRYSLNDDIRDLFDRATGPTPLDRNDPFAEENRRLRENEKNLWNKAKKVFARQFAPGGLLPESVFNEKITRDSEFQAIEFDVRHLSSALGKAVKADFGVEIDSLTADQVKPLAEALAGKVDPNIPEATKVAIVAMRQYIDSLSGEYLGILQKQVEANMQGADQALIDKITGNLGAYVNRSYQAFDDPKWFKNVPTEVVNAARTYLARGYMAQGETAAEARRLADVTVNEILKNGTAYDSMGAFIAEGKLGAKDLTVLIKRKEIAPEIRALLGEYIDQRLNFAKSATKMGRLVWNQRFLDRVLEFGMGTMFFEGKNRPAEATTQIAGEQSEAYAPLNGLWTTPEIAQAFKDALGKEQMSDLYRTVVRLNGMVKYGKTVLSPTTAMRNWQSAMFFSLANGHFDLTQMKKSWAAFREQVTQNATGDDLAYLRKLKKLGVVYDTPYAGEMMALLQDARMDELLSSKSGKPFSMALRSTPRASALPCSVVLSAKGSTCPASA